MAKEVMGRAIFPHSHLTDLWVKASIVHICVLVSCEGNVNFRDIVAAHFFLHRQVLVRSV